MSETNFFGLDVSVFESVIAVGDTDARIALTRQLVALVADPATAPIEIQQVGPVLLRLAGDDDKAVRLVLAQEFASSNRIDAQLAFSIIADDDDIALPFLAQTKALSAAQITVIAKVGDEARQTTIVKRTDVPPEACELVIGQGSAVACVALLQNAAIMLEDMDFHVLYKRFGNNTDIVERLLARPAIPAEIRITQARRTAARMRQMMAERGWIAANDASDLCADAEDNAVMQVLVESDEAGRAKALAFMAAKKLLTPAFVVRSAALGQMTVVEASLAHLTGFTPTRTAEQMYHRHSASFKALFKRSGLPMTCFGMLRAACDVMIDTREEGLEISSSQFGGRVLEALMTRYEAMSPQERAKQIEYLGRYGEDKIRKVAKRLRADLVRAA